MNCLCFFLRERAEQTEYQIPWWPKQWVGVERPQQGVSRVCPGRASVKRYISKRKWHSLEKFVTNVAVWIYNEEKIEADMIFISDIIATEVEK